MGWGACPEQGPHRSQAEPKYCLTKMEISATCCKGCLGGDKAFSYSYQNEETAGFAMETICRAIWIAWQEVEPLSVIPYLICTRNCAQVQIYGQFNSAQASSDKLKRKCCYFRYDGANGQITFITLIMNAFSSVILLQILYSRRRIDQTTMISCLGRKA